MQTRQVTQQAPSTATSQDFVVTDFGSVQAAIVMGTTGGSSSYAGNYGGISVGFWDGTNVATGFVTVQDDVAAAANNHRHGCDASDIYVANETGTAFRTATISSTTDGVRLTWGEADATERPYVTVILIKGINGAQAGWTATSTSLNTAVTTTTTGITPKLILFWSTGQITSATATASQPRYGFGFAYDNGSTYDQYCQLMRYTNTNPTAQSGRITSTYAVCQVPGTAGNVNTGGEVTNMASGSFDVTTRLNTLAGGFNYLALDFDADVHIFTDQTPVSPISADWDPFTSTFTPNWVFGLASAMPLLDQGYTALAQVEIFGLYSVNPDDTEATQTMVLGDDVSTNQGAQAAHWPSYRLDFDNAGSGTGAEFQASSPTFDSSGIVFPQANIDEVGDTARFFVGFAIEDTPAGVEQGPIIVPTGPLR